MKVFGWNKGGQVYVTSESHEILIQMDVDYSPAQLAEWFDRRPHFCSLDKATQIFNAMKENIPAPKSKPTVHRI